METVAAFFAGNPFATPVGQRIEQATDAGLDSENWALNMEICDLINETDEGPKDAVRAIRKRLQLNAGKNHTVVLYALTILETCVKNCGRRFHVLVCTKDFAQELVRLIGPKNDPPTEVQEKVLTMIQSWSDAFQQQPDMQGVVQVYQELKSKGIEFPMTNMDTMAPIITPQRTFNETAIPSAAAAVRPTFPRSAPVEHVAPYQPEEVANQTVILNSSQLSKLQRELDVVGNNMSVFSEMLSELNPGQEHPTDLELLRDLYQTCRAMQKRLVELLERVANDQVTAHLLKLNDDLNNLFLRYERYEKNRNAVTSPVRESLSRKASSNASQSLIDFGDSAAAAAVPSASAAAAAVPTISANMQSLNLNREEADFDMFAQSRTVTYESSKERSSNYGDPDQIDAGLGQLAQRRQQEGVKEEDIQAMEAWLDPKTGVEGSASGTLSPAMRNYLQQRARDPNTPRSKDQDHMFPL